MTQFGKFEQELRDHHIDVSRRIGNELQTRNVIVSPQQCGDVQLVKVLQDLAESTVELISIDNAS
eukprot:CAMPEP_0197064178 /NCGR_PEP_ID=MMETSP1384-20130603/157504_1 /TAXON_ID=29189 /ORGANISM="Ammonia sp." /LENGTH=64 /DNA_ID=CAMNT_0042500617 /DNA_START=156 /DNA_END=346 /DNA_ORIENTATION=+